MKEYDEKWYLYTVGSFKLKFCEGSCFIFLFWMIINSGNFVKIQNLMSEVHFIIFNEWIGRALGSLR